MDYTQTCSSAVPCLSQLACDSAIRRTPVCVTKLDAGPSSFCVSDSVCTDTLYCSAQQGPDTFNFTSLIQGFCVPRVVTGFCMRNRMCASGTCNNNGQCQPAINCTSDAQCNSAGGFQCQPDRGICMPKLAFGSLCFRSSQCASGGQCLASSLAGSPSFCMQCSTDGSLGACDSLFQFCNATTPIANCQTKLAAFSGCNSDSQCLSCQCDLVNGVCNPLGNSFACTSDGACLPTSFCYNALCAPRYPVGTQCFSNSYCANTPLNNIFCDPTIATCAFKCNNVDWSCPSGYYCPVPVTASNVTTQVASLQIRGCQVKLQTGTPCQGGSAGDIQCLSGYCDRASNRCSPRRALGQACSLSAECASGICDGLSDGATCTAPCTSDADCTYGRYCNITAGLCIGKKADGFNCTTDVECLSSYCNNTFVVPNTVTLQPVCAPRGGMNARCLAGLTGVGQNNRDCQPGLVCNNATNTCTKACRAGSDCPTGFSCNATSLCVPSLLANGLPCSNSSTCSSGSCDFYQHVCQPKQSQGGPCDVDTDCNPGLTCQLTNVAPSFSGTCQPGCIQDFQCDTSNSFYCTWFNATLNSRCNFLRRCVFQPCFNSTQCFPVWFQFSGVWGAGTPQDYVCAPNPATIPNVPVSPTGLYCKTALALNSGCSFSSECNQTSAPFCIKNPTPGATGNCLQCNTTSNCPSDSFCIIPWNYFTAGQPPNNVGVGVPVVGNPGNCVQRRPEGGDCSQTAQTTTQFSGTQPLSNWVTTDICLSSLCSPALNGSVTVARVCRGRGDYGTPCSANVTGPGLTDCKQGMSCDPTANPFNPVFTGFCYKPCITDFNCPAGQYCSPNYFCKNIRRPDWTTCQVDAECLSGLCDSLGKVCRSVRGVGGQCNTGNDCFPDLVCDRSQVDTIGGVCARRCLTSGDCPAPQTCNVQGACGLGGLTNDCACQSDLECASGYCDRNSRLCANKVQVNGTCSSNVQCLSGLCNITVATPNGACVQCTNTTNCPVGNYCGLSNNRRYCLPLKDIGVQCFANQECKTNMCLLNMCWIACTWSTTFACPAGTYCPLGLDVTDRSVTIIPCKPAMSSRSQCYSGAQCRSGRCNMGLCGI